MDGGLDDRTLRRIIALLVSFAALAERAAGRSLPVRWLVLTLLRYTYSVALDYVLESAPWIWPYLEDELEPGSSTADAVLLGRRLRILAAILGELLPASGPPDDWAAHKDPIRQRHASDILPFVLLPHGGRLAFHDSS